MHCKHCHWTEETALQLIEIIHLLKNTEGHSENDNITILIPRFISNG